MLFGLSSFNLGITIAKIYWLLYFIPLVSICYDLYIMSADSRIKRIEAFLGRHNCSQAGDAENEWVRFCINYRDGLAPSAGFTTWTLGKISGIWLRKTSSPVEMEMSPGSRPISRFL